MSEQQARFDALYQEYRPMVRSIIWHRTGRGDVMDDLEQDTWERIWKALPKFQEGNTKGWVQAVTCSSIAEYRRKQARHHAPTSVASLEEVREIAGFDVIDEATDIAAFIETQERIWKALHILPRLIPEQRAVLQLLGAGYNPKEIAQLLKISVVMVYDRSRNGRKRLRQLYDMAV